MGREEERLIDKFPVGVSMCRIRCELKIITKSFKPPIKAHSCFILQRILLSVPLSEAL